jgi:hypothetical protein
LLCLFGLLALGQGKAIAQVDSLYLSVFSSLVPEDILPVSENYTLSHTLGEPLIGRAVAGTYLVTSGFQQTGMWDGPGVTFPRFRLRAAALPNPTSGLVRIGVELEETPTDVKLELLSSSGLSLWQRDIPQANRVDIAVDISNQPPGIYYLRIRVAYLAVDHTLTIIRI